MQTKYNAYVKRYGKKPPTGGKLSNWKKALNSKRRNCKEAKVIRNAIKY